MRSFVLAALFVTGIPVVSVAGNWPAWRGPHGTGVADETGVPIRWSKTENVAWKASLPAPGNSTPIVWENRIYLTQADKTGKQRALVCLDFRTGRRLWEKSVDYAEPEKTHETNPQCSPSPVTDGEVVIAWHGSAGLFAYDLEGKERWRADLGKFEHIWGTGSSPVLYEDLVILNAGPGLRAFVVAFDRQTGKEVWRREFPNAASEKVDQFRGSWATPVLHRRAGETTLLLGMPGALRAIEPATGRDVWQCNGLGELVYASPVFSDDVIVAMSGYHGPAMAVRAGGKGDVTESHRLWRKEERKFNPQRVGSGVIAGEHFYILNENGIAWCLEPATGKVLWEERLGGTSWSSMSHVDGRLYANNMDGDTFVLEADPAAARVIAENPIGETTRASLVFSNGRALLRTYENLYCFGGTTSGARSSGE
jgi:outer membrane protein assembly factor BamB